jgi:hypothetical protein
MLVSPQVRVAAEDRHSELNASQLRAAYETKTVGPPDSGELNVRWDGKGMANWS